MTNYILLIVYMVSACFMLYICLKDIKERLKDDEYKEITFIEVCFNFTFSFCPFINSILAVLCLALLIYKYIDFNFIDKCTTTFFRRLLKIK